MLVLSVMLFVIFIGIVILGFIIIIVDRKRRANNGGGGTIATIGGKLRGVLSLRWCVLLQLKWITASPFSD